MLEFGKLLIRVGITNGRVSKVFGGYCDDLSAILAQQWLTVLVQQFLTVSRMILSSFLSIAGSPLAFLFNLGVVLEY